MQPAPARPCIFLCYAFFAFSPPSGCGHIFLKKDDIIFSIIPFFSSSDISLIFKQEHIDAIFSPHAIIFFLSSSEIPFMNSDMIEPNVFSIFPPPFDFEKILRDFSASTDIVIPSIRDQRGYTRGHSSRPSRKYTSVQGSASVFLAPCEASL